MDSTWFNTIKLLKVEDKATACMFAKDFSRASLLAPFRCWRFGMVRPICHRAISKLFLGGAVSIGPYLLGFWNQLDASKASPTGHVLVSGSSAWHRIKWWQPSKATAEASKLSQVMSNSQVYHKYVTCFPQKLANHHVSIVLLYWQVWLAGSGSHSLSKQTLKA